MFVNLHEYHSYVKSHKYFRESSEKRQSEGWWTKEEGWDGWEFRGPSVTRRKKAISSRNVQNLKVHLPWYVTHKTEYWNKRIIL